MSVEPWIDAWPRSATIPPPGRPHVPEQLLDDAGGADRLDAGRVLRPADGVDERAGALPAGVLRERLRHLDEVVDRAAARLRDELRRVPRVVPLEDLEDAARMHKRRVLRRRLAVREPFAAAAVTGLLAGRRAARAGDLHPLVHPALDLVLPGLGVPAGEEAVRVLGVDEALVDDHRRVRVALDVVAELEVVLEDVVRDPAEERDIATGADADVLRAHRARACEARVDVDDLRAALPGLEHPLETHRVVLGHVRAHDHDAVGVLQVLLEVRGPASSERGAQTGHRGAVSYAGLVLDLDDAETRHELLDEVVLLVVERRAAEVPDRHRAVRRVAVLGCRLPRRGARCDDPVGDHLHRVAEGELLPGGAVRRAVLDLVLAERAVREALRRLALRAEAPARDRGRRVALDVRDLAALDVDQLAAADGAVRADGADDAVGLVDPRGQRRGARRLRRFPEAVEIAFAELPERRPRLEQLPEYHRILVFRAGPSGKRRLAAEPRSEVVVDVEARESRKRFAGKRRLPDG